MTQITLLMLHGGGGSGQTMDPLAKLLAPHFKIEAPNLIGHGGRPIPARITMDDWRKDLIEHLDRKKIARAVVYGHSVGGTLALNLAKHHPERVSGLITLAAKIVFDQPAVDHFVHLCQVDKIERSRGVPEMLAKQHHPQDWKQLCRTMAAFYPQLLKKPAITDDELRSLQIPTLVMSGTEDTLVPWTETMRLSRLLPQATALGFAGNAHPLRPESMPFVATNIKNWAQEMLKPG